MWRQHWPAGVLTVLALALRVGGIDRRSVWFDEAVTFVNAHIPFDQLIASLQYDVHPPLSYVLYHLWPWLDGGDLLLRLPSAVLGALSVPVVYAWVYRIDRPATAALAAAFIAVSPQQIDLSQDARMYGLLVVLTAFSLLALDRLLTCPSRGSAVAYAITAVAMLYTHYYAAFLLAAEGIAAAASALRRTTAQTGTSTTTAPPPEPSPETTRSEVVVDHSALAQQAARPRGGSAVAGSTLARAGWPHSGSALARSTLARAGWPLLSLGAAAVLFVPWLPVLRQQAGSIAGDYWIERPSSTTLWVTFRELVAHTPPDEPFRLALRVAYVVLAGLLLVGALQAARKHRQWPALALATLPILLAIAVSVAVTPIYATRYVSAVGIAWALLIGRGITSVPRPWSIPLAAVAFFPAVLSLWSLYADPGYGRPDLRAAAQAIQAQHTNNEVILHLGAFTASPFDYYGAEPGLVLETNDRSELCNALRGRAGGWLVTTYATADDDARAAAEGGITRPDYAADLVRGEPSRALGVSVFHLQPCAESG